MMISKISAEIRKLNTGEKIFLVFLIFSQVYYFYRYAFRYGSPLAPPGYSLTPALLQQGKYALALAFFLILAFYAINKFKLELLVKIFSKQKIWWLILLFIGYTTLSLFKFGFNLDSFAVTQTAKMLFVVPFVFFIPILWKDNPPFSVLKIFLIFSFAYHVLYDLLMIGNFFIFGRLPGLHLSRVVGRFGGGWDDPNGFAAFLVLLIVVLLAIPEKLIGKKSQCHLSLLGVTTLLLFFTYSLTGLIGLAFSLGLLFLMKSLSFRKVFVLLMAVLLFIGLVYYLGYFDIIYGNKLASSKIHLSGPVTTSGGLQLGYLKFLTPIFGSFEGASFHENFYLQTSLNYGLVGLAMILLILVATVLKLYNAWREADIKREPEKKLFFTVSLVYLPAFALMNLGIPFFQVFPINLFAWAMIGLVWSLAEKDWRINLKSNNPSDQVILSRLVDLGQRESLLEQFRSLASAFQYYNLYKLFRRIVPKGAKVLDWGAGNGHFSYWLLKAGYKAVGYGFEGYTYKSWLADPSYQYTKGSSDSPIALPYSDGSFDAVASVGVLEHVRQTGGDELASLKEINRILKPGGLFVCYHLPNRYSLVEFFAKFFPKKHHHRFRYSSRDIKKLSDKANFNLIEIGLYGFLPRNSLNRLPQPAKKSEMVAISWDMLDIALSFILRPLCQNYYFVAQKST